MPHHAPDESVWTPPQPAPDDPEEESGDALAVGQFRLRTLFLVTSAVAVFFSLLAWLGPLVIAAVAGGAIGAFLGMLLCLVVGLEAPLENLKVDVVRCLVAATALVGITYLCLRIVMEPPVLVFVVFLQFIVTRVVWIETDHPEAILIEISTFLGLAGAAFLLGMLV